MIETAVTTQTETEMKTSHWIVSKDGNDCCRALYDAHYSRRRYIDGRKPKLFVGPGEKLVLLGFFIPALFIWRKFISMDAQIGVNCSVFRNESTVRSSDLILEAEHIARKKWPQERFYTYVNARKIKSTNPGYCFKMAGWVQCGKTKNGLVVLQKLYTVGGNAT